MGLTDAGSELLPLARAWLGGPPARCIICTIIRSTVSGSLPQHHAASTRAAMRRRCRVPCALPLPCTTRACSPPIPAPILLKSTQINPFHTHALWLSFFVRPFHHRSPPPARSPSNDCSTATRVLCRDSLSV